MVSRRFRDWSLSFSASIQDALMERWRHFQFKQLGYQLAVQLANEQKKNNLSRSYNKGNNRELFGVAVAQWKEEEKTWELRR